MLEINGGGFLITYRKEGGRLFLSRFDPERSSGVFSPCLKDALIFETYEEANFASSYFDKSRIEILTQVLKAIGRGC